AALQNVDVATIARDVVSELSVLAPNRLQVSAPVTAFAAGDVAELHEAVKNIVDNAIKYARGSPVEIAVSVEADTLSLRVCDTGPGMSEQDREHAFDRFYRGEARSQAEGSGLGLAIAKRAAERSGGTIAIESGSAAGTCVTIRLPAATPPFDGNASGVQY
ncbi:MAG: sensor histidine kinase, partial [Rhodanobacteraceae bacterium]